MRYSLIIAGLVFLLDQLTKYAVVAYLPYLESHVIISGLLYLTHVRNVGGAFGILGGHRLLFFATVGLMVAAFLFFWREISALGRLAVVSTGLALGGAMGNFVDRARLGYVVDFLDIRVWPVFNVADSAICIGVALLAWCLIRAKKV